MDLVTALACVAAASWVTTAVLAWRMAQVRRALASAARRPAGEPSPTADLVRLLRVQRHGFLNHLQVISGWLQLKRPERALHYIDVVRRKREQDGRLLKLADWRLLALLLDKTASAETAEVEVEWQIDSDMEGAPPELLEWLDRAFDEASAEAARSETDRTVRGTLSRAGDGYRAEIVSPAARREREFRAAPGR